MPAYRCPNCKKELVAPPEPSQTAPRESAPWKEPVLVMCPSCRRWVTREAAAPGRPASGAALPGYPGQGC
jgi:hypothetical protein